MSWNDILKSRKRIYQHWIFLKICLAGEHPPYTVFLALFFLFIIYQAKLTSVQLLKCIELCSGKDPWIRFNLGGLPSGIERALLMGCRCSWTAPLMWWKRPSGAPKSPLWKSTITLKDWDDFLALWNPFFSDWRWHPQGSPQYFWRAGSFVLIDDLTKYLIYSFSATVGNVPLNQDISVLP